MDKIDKVMGAMKEAMRPSISFEPRGIGAYLVHTGHTYPDGDELRIVLRNRDGEWILTDDGHTMMWLSYGDFKLTESRKALLDTTLASNCAEIEDGRIWISLAERDPAAVLTSFIQTLIQVADLPIYLSRHSVRSTFSEDVRDLFRETLGDKCEFDKKITNNNETYDIDVYVREPVPILVFAITSQEKAVNAAYAILALSVEKKMKFTSLAIVDSKITLRAEDEKRIANKSDKLFFDVPGKEDADFTRFLARNTATSP